MSRIEYAAVLIGIVVGLALSNILTSLHRLMEAGSRVRWHWMAPTIALSAAVLTLGAFWHQWIVARSLPQPRHLFYASLPLYAAFSFLFLACAATLPDRVPDRQGIDLREYYFANTRRVWGLFAGGFAFGLVTVAVEFFLNGWDVAVLRENLVPTIAVCVAGLLLSVISLLTLAAWWHRIAVIAGLLLFLGLYGPMQIG